jgi:hypothetical protein
MFLLLAYNFPNAKFLRRSTEIITYMFLVVVYSGIGSLLDFGLCGCLYRRRHMHIAF